MIRLSPIVAILALAASITVSNGQFQPPIPTSSSDVVTVAIKDHFPQPHIAALVRRTPGRQGRDIIALRRSAVSPELLALAVGALKKSRETQGPTVARRITIVIPVGISSPLVSGTERTQMVEAITQLLATPPRAVPAIGHVPALELSLSP